MNEDRRTSPSAFERADQVVNKVGVQVGRWAGRVVRRMQHTAQLLSQEAKRAEAGIEHRREAGTHPTMQRAEALVDHFGHNITNWTMESNIKMRRAFAHWREDIEDMWVEAQAAQRQRHAKGRTEVHEEHE